MHYLIPKKRLASPGKWEWQLVTLCPFPEGLDGTQDVDKVRCPNCIKLLTGEPKSSLPSSTSE